MSYGWIEQLSSASLPIFQAAQYAEKADLKINLHNCGIEFKDFMDMN